MFENDNPIAILLLIMFIGGFIVSTIIAYHNFPDDEE